MMKHSSLIYCFNTILLISRMVDFCHHPVYTPMIGVSQYKIFTPWWYKNLSLLTSHINKNQQMQSTITIIKYDITVINLLASQAHLQHCHLVTISLQLRNDLYCVKLYSLTTLSLVASFWMWKTTSFVQCMPSSGMCCSCLLCKSEQFSCMLANLYDDL